MLNINIPLDEVIEIFKVEIKSAIAEAINQVHSVEDANVSEQLLTRKEACDLLGISLPTLAKHIASGKLPYSRIGKKVLFDKSTLLSSLSKKGGKNG
ncbi:DNA-binding protein [bacterium]|nr:MAG: DNA-binding protein [bacterium]